MNCKYCGAKIKDGFTFCTECGKSQEEVLVKEESQETFTGLKVKYEMILIYFLPAIGLIASFYKKKNYSNLVLFNYHQATSLFLIEFPTILMFGLFTVIIPFIGAVIILFNILMFVFHIIAIINAYDGIIYKIPLVNDLTDKIFKQN